MTRCILLAGLLLTSVPVAAEAQPRVPVRDTATVGILEQLDLAVRRALVPWSMDVAPLHAYDPGLICDTAGRHTELTGHRGTAAIVFEADEETDEESWDAAYHPTVREAVDAAREMCSRSADGKWYFATTYPVDGVAAERHFMTRDVEGIAELLGQSVDR